MPAPDHRVTEHFVITIPEKGKGAKARCKHCNGFNQAHRPDRERGHRYECKKYRNYMRSNGKEKDILRREKKTSSIDQSGPLEAFIQGHGSLSKDKNEADLLFAQAIYYSGLPFTVFDNPCFKIAFKAINYTPPKREALRTTLLSKTYNNLESRAQSDFLDACERLAFSADESSNTRRERIANLSILTPHGVAFHGVSLDTKATKHTAEELFNIYSPRMLEFAGNDKTRINALVTDSCAVMRKLWEYMEVEYPHIFCVPDDPHGKQLLIKDLLIATDMKPFFEKAARIVNNFNNAPLQLALLKLIQHRMYGREHAFKTHGFTRWGTSEQMLASLHNSKAAILDFAEQDLADLKDKALLSNGELWRAIDGMLQVLQPITEQLQMAEDHSYTIGRVYKSWKDTKEHLDKMANSKNMFAASIRDYMTRRSKKGERSWEKRLAKQLLPLHLTAYYVDPGAHGDIMNDGVREKMTAFFRKYIPETAAAAEAQFNEFRHKSGRFSSIKLLWRTWEESKKDNEAVKQFWMTAVSSPLIIMLY
jgi:hypothetical protein